MNFYNQLTQFYDQIFPVNPDQVRFLEGVMEKDDFILDIGCAKGSLLQELSKKGIKGIGIDLNQQMINDAKNKNIKNMSFLVIDMLKIDEIEEEFDCITCLGNTLVHLDNENQILLLFNKVYQKLNNNGVFCLQIINYDRIINNKVPSLPTIETDNVSLERHYQLDKDKILFITYLKTLKNELKNEVVLIPIRKQQMIDLLTEAQFKDLKIFGDFKRNVFDENKSMHLVIEARK